MTPPVSHDPIATLGKSLGKEILIKCKRQKKFKGKLKSFDSHLNVLLESVHYTYNIRSKEKDGEMEEKCEDLDRIILRGDSIVFIGLSV